MKRWAFKQPTTLLEKEFPAIEDGLMECVYCFNRAQLLYKGTSMCRPCFQEKQRIGQI